MPSCQIAASPKQPHAIQRAFDHCVKSNILCLLCPVPENLRRQVLPLTDSLPVARLPPKPRRALYHAFKKKGQRKGRKRGQADECNAVRELSLAEYPRISKTAADWKKTKGGLQRAARTLLAVPLLAGIAPRPPVNFRSTYGRGHRCPFITHFFLAFDCWRSLARRSRSATHGRRWRPRAIQRERMRSGTGI